MGSSFRLPDAEFSVEVAVAKVPPGRNQVQTGCDSTGLVEGLIELRPASVDKRLEWDTEASIKV